MTPTPYYLGDPAFDEPLRPLGMPRDPEAETYEQARARPRNSATELLSSYQRARTPDDLSSGPRARMGRSRATGDAATAYSERDAAGRSRRVLGPQELEQSGGVEEGGKVGYMDQGGESLGSMADAIDEINATSPNHLAFADRGGIRVRNVGAARRRSALDYTDVQGAKQHQAGLADAGMESTYRAALTAGNTDHARLLAERMYRRGMDPGRLRAIQSEVSSSQALANTPQPLTHQQIQDLTAQLDATRDTPGAWEQLAVGLAAAGHADIASHVRSGAQQLETNRRLSETQHAIDARTGAAEAGRQKRFDTSDENADANRALKEKQLAETMSYHEVTVGQRAASDAARFKQQAAAAESRDANQVHASVEKKLQSLHSAIVAASVRKASTIGNSGNDDAAVQQMLADGLGDDEEFRDIVLDAYEAQRKHGMDPYTAADFALRRVHAGVGASRRSSRGADLAQEPLEQQQAPAAPEEDSEQAAAARY